LSLGLMLGLTGVALAAVWERLAYTGLLNFSTDYRTTALFWEMQVGGAALDGFLALTVPFAVLMLWTARERWRWTAAAGLSMLAAYVCLTTFSRGVYFAVPIGVGATVWLLGSQGARRSVSLPGNRDRPDRGPLWTGVVLIFGFAAAAATMFPTSGYRGLLALLGAVLLLLPLAGVLTACTVREWLLGLGCGAMLSGAAAFSAFALPKGAYLTYAVTVLSTFAILAWRRKYGSAAAAPLALAGFVTALTSVGLVTLHWGYEPALRSALPVIVALLAVALAASRIRLLAWPQGLRWQGSAFGTMVLVGISIGVFSGGAYMGDRFSTSSADLRLRTDHWQQSLALLLTPEDLLLGKGLGRFPANFALATRDGERPGDYRWLAEGDNGYLALSGGTHVMGWGELLRVSQRVDVPQGAATVRVDVRAAQPVTLHVEVCEKHLLYNGGCVIGKLAVQSLPGQWQTLHVALSGGPLTRGLWYAPRLLAFSIGIESGGRRVEVDNLALIDAGGSNLLSNGDFSDGMAHWFFTSDRNHLPWHAKNLALHVLFEQGLIGLALFGALVIWSLWRVTAGHGRDHPLAPGIAGALIGFMVVGAFDSLLNVPRLAFLFYFLTLVGLTVRSRLGHSRPARPEAPVYPTTRSMLGAATLLLATGLGGLAMAGAAHAAAPAPTETQQTLRVGPLRALKTIAAASRLVRDGTAIEVDAGTYIGDTAVWTHNDLSLRAIGGRVRLIANGAAAEGKGIWVVRARHMSVEGFDFEGAAVPSRNGAGIRLETGSLRVRDCSFMHNEMGLLTNNDPDTELDIENSEFAYNQRPDGHNHNLYAGTIKRLSVTGSYFHHAHIGHLLKSRAAFNH
ncbi:MAG: hypothetical protein H7306_13515, partial [Bacteriovorax sp.]|nr:hypothetical protein [Rhizobacter sp.]